MTRVGQCQTLKEANQQEVKPVMGFDRQSLGLLQRSKGTIIVAAVEHVACVPGCRPRENRQVLGVSRLPLSLLEESVRLVQMSVARALHPKHEMGRSAGTTLLVLLGNGESPLDLALELVVLLGPEEHLGLVEKDIDL